MARPGGGGGGRWGASGGRAALTARAGGGGEGGTGAGVGWACWYFWWARSYHREGRRWMEEVLRCPLPAALRGRALVVAGTLAWGHGDHERCERYSEEGP